MFNIKMLNCTVLQKVQVMFVATTMIVSTITTTGVWANLVLNHPKYFPETNNRIKKFLYEK